MAKLFANYGELLALAVLCYFSGHLSLWFTLPFGAVLCVIAILKASHPLPSETSLAGVCSFAAEVSCIFVVGYYHGPSSILIVSALGIALLLMVLTGIIELPETSVLARAALILGGLGYFAAFLFGKNVAAIACVWLIFAGCILLLPDNWLVTGGVLVGCSILLLVVRETGTIMVLVISALFYLLMTGDRKLRYVLLAGTGATGAAWVGVWFYDPLFRKVYALSDSETFHRCVQRVWLNFTPDDQISMISQLSRRPLRETVLLLAAPAERADILLYDTAHYSVLSDYVYDLATFSSGFYAVLFAVILVVSYAWCIYRHRMDKLSIIPIMLMVQSSVHIMGNLMCAPFTGLPMPFISFANFQLIVSFGMLILMTNAEMKGESL